MTEWDLTPVMAKYLDPQLVIGLLEFLDNQKVHPAFPFFGRTLTAF